MKQAETLPGTVAATKGIPNSQCSHGVRQNGSHHHCSGRARNAVGWLALVLDTPLTAVVLVIVRMLYVEDTLGDELVSISRGQTRDIAIQGHRMRSVERCGHCGYLADWDGRN